MEMEVAKSMKQESRHPFREWEVHVSAAKAIKMRRRAKKKSRKFGRTLEHRLTLLRFTHSTPIQTRKATKRVLK